MNAQLFLAIVPTYSIRQKNYLGHFFTHPVGVLKWYVIEFKNKGPARKRDFWILVKSRRFTYYYWSIVSEFLSQISDFSEKTYYCKVIWR